MYAAPSTRPPTPAYAAIIDHGSVTFLTGQAWAHTEISYRIQADATVDDLPIAVVRRAIANWNDALATAPIARVRHFRLVPAAPASQPDIVIRVCGGAAAVDGTSEIVSDREGAIVEALVRLTWPSPASVDDLGILGSVALRAIGRALGIGHAADPSDPMYPAFNGVKLRPSRSNVAAFAAVEEWYVARSPFFYPPRGYTVVSS